MNKNKKILVRFLEGLLLGLGAVLPGISGGVLCVMFGVYKPVIETLSNPKKYFKKNAVVFVPIALGTVVGFVIIAKVLAIFLEKYADVSTCLFVGLIAGMFPSLFKEAGKNGRNKFSFVSLFVSAATTLAFLIFLGIMSVEIVPNTFWYAFCGVCMAISIIAPGMSFSTLLMPLGLYTPFVDGIGNLNFAVIVPMLIGAVAAIVLLSNAVNALFEKHYSVAFHAIVGIVFSATLVIVPFGAFTKGAVSLIANIAAIAVGAIVALWFSKFDVYE